MTLRVSARAEIPLLPLSDFPELGEIPIRRRTTGAFESQEKSNWCWAASLQMVLGNRELPKPGQCALASKVFRQQACCTRPDLFAWAHPCNSTISVTGIDPTFRGQGVTTRFLPSAVPFQTLVSEISQNRMILAGIKFWLPQQRSYAGHAILIVGWDSNLDGDFLVLFDPARGIVADWYEDVLSAYGRGSWYATWIGIGA